MAPPIPKKHQYNLWYFGGALLLLLAFEFWLGYRSTVAPYTTLRPVAPSPWKEQNERAAPAPKSGR